MDRATRDKFASGTDQKDLTTGNACWETAPLIFQKLNEDFGPFDIDLTADEQRHLCPVWFGLGSPTGLDALTADWSAFSRGYSNPPYGAFVQRILPIAKRAAAQDGVTSVFLLPMRVTAAFKSHILQGASDLLFCDKRLVFFENGSPRVNQKAWKETQSLRADTAMFDSIIVRYAPGAPLNSYPKLGTWKVPIHVIAPDLERARVSLLAAQ